MEAPIYTDPRALGTGRAEAGLVRIVPLRSNVSAPMIEFLKKYRWYLLSMLAVYAFISIWLFFLTDSPQNVPFEYQVN